MGQQRLYLELAWLLLSVHWEWLRNGPFISAPTVSGRRGPTNSAGVASACACGSGNVACVCASSSPQLRHTHTRTLHRVCPIKKWGMLWITAALCPLFIKEERRRKKKKKRAPHWNEAQRWCDNLSELGPFVLFPRALSTDSNPSLPKWCQFNFKCNITTKYHINNACQSWLCVQCVLRAKVVAKRAAIKNGNLGPFQAH